MTFVKQPPKPSPLGDGEWILTDEAAARLRVHKETIREMLRDGRLQGRKLGPRIQHHWLVSAAQVAEKEKELLAGAGSE
jgi:excisionase family DNA binding protein